MKKALMSVLKSFLNKLRNFKSNLINDNVPQSIIAIQSQLDERFIVAIIYKEHPTYEKYSHIFTEYGHSFLSWNSNTIWIDGEYVNTHECSELDILITSASELVHYIYRHWINTDKMDNKILLYTMYTILKDSNLEEAKQAVEHQYKDLYTDIFSFKLDEYHAHMLKLYLNDRPKF